MPVDAEHAALFAQPVVIAIEIAIELAIAVVVGAAILVLQGGIAIRLVSGRRGETFGRFGLRHGVRLPPGPPRRQSEAGRIMADSSVVRYLRPAMGRVFSGDSS
jgi:hypothetical protein